MRVAQTLLVEKHEIRLPGPGANGEIYGPVDDVEREEDERENRS